MLRDHRPGARVVSTRHRLVPAALCTLTALALPTQAEAAPHAGDDFLVTTSRTSGDTPPDVPDGLVLVDAQTGATRRVLSLEDVRLEGALLEDDGSLLLIDRGDFPRRGRILRYWPDQERVEVATEGGFLCAPQRLIPHTGAGFLVADEGPPGGTGAILHVDRVDGSQRLVAFAHLTRPQDLALGGGGELYVVGSDLSRIDLGTGERRRLGPAFGWDQTFGIDIDELDRLLVAQRDGGVGRILRLDPRTGTIEELLALPERLRDVVAGPAESFVFTQGGPSLFGLGYKPGAAAHRYLASGYDLHGARSVLALGDSDLFAQEPGAGPPRLSVPQSPLAGFEPPPLPPLPRVSIVVNRDTVTLLNGEGPQDDRVLAAGRYPLVTALRAATPGSDPVIGIEGEIPGDAITIGGGDAGDKAYVAHWGPVPMRFAVLGLTEDARIREFGLCDRLSDGTETGGVTDAWFANLTIEARFAACVLIPKTHTFGSLRFYKVHFAAGREALAEGNYSGLGYRWGVRGHGRGRWDFRYCSFDPVEEHAIYIDSPQGDSVFQNIEHRGSHRTAIQVVNRSIDNPGPSGWGTLLFDTVHVHDLWGQGGGGITVAGHLGDVVMRHVRVTEDPATGRSHGAIVVWTDDGPGKGTYLFTGADGGLYSTRSVTIESLTVDLPHADRPHVAISGVESVYIDRFDIAGNETAFSFDSSFGAPTVEGTATVDGKATDVDGRKITNGKIHFLAPCPLSAYPGFRSGRKITERDGLLDDAAIDARWCD